MSLLLKCGTIVTMNDRKEVLTDHDLFLEGGRIAGIAPTGSIVKGGSVEELPCEGKIIIPGLVSAHSHLSGIFQRSLWDETSFESWSAKTSAMDSLVDLSPEEIYLLHCAACVELLRHGVTTALDMFNCYPMDALDKVEAAGKALLDTGMKGIVAYALRDQSPDNRGVTVQSTSAEAIVHTARAAAEKVIGLGARLAFMLAPSAPQRCSDKLLVLCAELAQELGVGIHTHLAEAKRHAEIGRAMYRESIVGHLERLGFLNSSLSAAHSVWLDDEEIGLLRKYDVKVVHNPASNMRLGSGVARVKEMIRSGLCVGLGTDSANAGTVYSIFEQMRLAVLMPRCVWPPENWVSPYEALEMATIGGARALLLDRLIGSIEEGKRADLVILNPVLSLSPLHNLVNQLVFSENGDSVETVLVEGEPVLLRRRLQRVDEEDIFTQVSSLKTRIRDTQAAVLARPP